MSPTDADLPNSAELVGEAHNRACDWLESDQASDLRRFYLRSLSDTDAVVQYFGDWKEEVKSLEHIARYFLEGYFGAGTGNGNALRIDPVSAIVRSYLGDKDRLCGDRIENANQLRADHPGAFNWMLRLASQHARICQETLTRHLGTHFVSLYRGVRDPRRHYAIESWAYRGSVSNYGPVTLRAEVPLASVLSIRRQEHEIVVIRNTWEPTEELPN